MERLSLRKSLHLLAVFPSNKAMQSTTGSLHLFPGPRMVYMAHHFVSYLSNGHLQGEALSLITPSKIKLLLTDLVPLCCLLFPHSTRTLRYSFPSFPFPSPSMLSFFINLLSPPLDYKLHGETACLVYCYSHSARNRASCSQNVC